jgi:hypothetical protein
VISERLSVNPSMNPSIFLKTMSTPNRSGPSADNGEPARGGQAVNGEHC